MLPRRPHDAPGQPERITRCPSCGRRIAGACPVHGAPTISDDDDDTQTSGVRTSALSLQVPGHAVERLVARGGFGVVLETVRARDGRRTAVKVARADKPLAAACLAREIEALRQIGPPWVPELLEEGLTADGSPYLAMELVNAGTLAEQLAQQPAPAAIDEAGALVLALLDALQAVHARGYAHRDLKPENILVLAGGRVVLVDFGTAGAASGVGEAEGDLLGEGDFGTAEYMAPEQCEGRRDVDVRADLYAVGVILFELLAGRPPFWGTRALVQERHLSRRPPRVATAAGGRAIPAAIEEVVARCLAKDRADRFASAAELRAALATALRDTASLPAPTPQATAEARLSGSSERLLVGVLYFESAAAGAVVQKQVVALGGQLGRAQAGRYVAVFAADLADNPVQRAATAAGQLVRRGVCAAVRVDVTTVVAQSRRDGSRRFVGPALTRDDRHPAPDGPPGVQIAPAAAAVLPADEVGDDPTGSRAPSTPLFGRDAVLTALTESALAVSAGSAPAEPTVVTVSGDQGHGKTRLARALLGRLAARVPGARVLTLQAREPAAGDLDPALRALLVDVLELPFARPADGGDTILRERLEGLGCAHLAPALALALGWISQDRGDSPLRVALRALDAAPGALGSALVLIASEALRRRLASAPLLVIIDDAHLAGEAVLAALEYAARADAALPIWVCALGRPAFAAERPSWGAAAARRERHHLGPLDPAAAGALCRRLLLPAESVPDEVVRRIVERAEATPLLLVELVRGLHREGLVRRSPKGESYYLAADELDQLPDLPLIEWAARRELLALAPSLRSHARLIAILGDRVRPEEIESLLHRLGQSIDTVDLPLDPKIGLRRLAAAGVIVTSSGGRVGVRRALREAIIRTIPAALRRTIHLAAAQHYAEQTGDDGDDRLVQLAWHASEGGLGEEAAGAYFTLAERTRARHAYTEAERFYSRALDQKASLGALHLRAAYRGRGQMRYRIGRYHDALTDLAEAYRLTVEAGATGEVIEILLDEATALDWMDDYKRSGERVEMARVHFDGAPAEVRTPLLEAQMLLGRGRAAFRASRREEGAALLEQAARLSETLGDDAYKTLVIALIQLGFLLPDIGRVVDGRLALDRAVTLAGERGDLLHLGSALNVRGLLWANLGDKPRFVADMERSLALARALGQGTLEMIGEFNFGEYLLLMDDAAAADVHIRRARALDRRITGDPGLASVTLLEARLHFYRGEDAEAAEVLARLRAREEAGPVLAPSDEVLRDAITLALDDAPPRAWEALETRSARFSVGQERIEVLETRGAASARRGRAGEAQGHFLRAAQLAAASPSAMRGRLERQIAAGLPRR